MSKAVINCESKPNLLNKNDRLITSLEILPNGETMSQRKTRPAKEEDLIVPNGNHAMSPGDGTPYELRQALVDGLPAKAGIDAFGGYSERIRIEFEQAHEQLGPGFQTKYFMIRSEEPGVCHWGHNGDSFTIEVFVDEV